MANSESERLSQKSPRARGKLLQRSERLARSPEASLEAIRKTGWTPEVEAVLLDASTLIQLQPPFLDNLVKEAKEQRDANLWRLLAGLCERRNEDQRAILYATEALQVQPGDVATMGLLARLCEKRHADAEAIDWYQRILAVDPAHIAANRFFAILHYRRGEYETALLHLTRLVEAEPKVRIHKLYLLLTKVKSAGIHGLAQSLTEVRRWRSFTPEETPLAHELFVLVGKQCLHAKQRVRAKQYFSRALQLAPTPEVESLLAGVSDPRPPTTSETKAPAPFPLERRPVTPFLSTVLNGLRSRSKIYETFTSGAGIITAAVVVALFGLWNLPYTPQRRTIIELQDEEEPAVEGSQSDLPSEQKVTTLNRTPLASQQQTATVPVSPVPALSSVQEATTQRETRKTEPLSSLSPKAADKPLPSRTSLLKENSASQPVPPSPSSTATDIVLLNREPASIPTPQSSVSVVQSTTKKEVPKPTVSSSPGEKSSTGSTGNTSGKKANLAAAKLTPPATSALPAPVSATPVVETKLSEESVSPAEVHEALSPGVTSTESAASSGSGVDATAEKSDKPKTIGTSWDPSVPSLSVRDIPAIETQRTEETVPTRDQQEAPPLAITLTESARTEEPLPSSEMAEQETRTAAAVEEQPPTSSVGTQTLPAAGDPPGEDQTTTVSDSSSVRTVANASNAIVRLSAQLPHTARFPTRERLVSVPPDQLLPTMKALMKQETGANRVATPARGVLRARVSGRRTSGARTPKVYGQYLVEVVPGPTGGTSRVRAKALIFDWRTRQPIEDTGSLADRLLEKVGE